MVKKRFPEKLDASRLDAAIALYMRCAGYTTQEVANELFRHTPARPNGQSRDERIEYGRRMVWYAFGTAREYWYCQCQAHAGTDSMLHP